MMKVSEFDGNFGIIQAFELIGGTHISIKCSLENSLKNIPYKQYFVLNVHKLYTTIKVCLKMLNEVGL